MLAPVFMLAVAALVAAATVAAIVQVALTLDRRGSAEAVTAWVLVVAAGFFGTFQALAASEVFA